MIFVAAVFAMAFSAQAIAAATDASLSSITTSAGTLAKASDNTTGFLSTQLAYRVAVPSGTTTFDLTPTATEAASTIEISFANGPYSSVASGTPSSSYTLASGVNLFKVKVTAPDTATIKIYEVRVVKELNDNTNMLQISFTGMTSLPDKLVLLGANSLEVAWTLGADLTNATWKNIPNSSATSLVYIPRPDVLPTVSASETWVMTVRGDVDESATRTSPNLYGFQGASSALGTSSTAVANGSQYMKEVISLGQFSNFQSLRTAFYGSKTQLVISCKLPNSVRSLNSTFESSTFNDPSISSWDVKAVTDLSSTFAFATSFNQDLSAWYTGSVVSLNSVFRGASAFNKSIDTWNTSAVTVFSSAFLAATSFNQPLDSWNTAKVTTMADMFFGATAFNQPLGSWNTSKVTNMAQMFRDAPLFNQNLSGWDVSKVISFNNMFSRVNQTPGAFNNGSAPGVSGVMAWNTIAATDMGGMFNNSSAFNQDISSWNTANVSTMKDMFRSATAFNQPIGVWNTAKLENIEGTFFGASSFNQTLNTWNTSKVTSSFDTFNAATSFNQPLDNWNVSLVTNMSGMFKDASAFNQSLNAWDISNVTTISSMFYNATSFNNGLTAGTSGSFTWKLGSKLTSALSTFDGASSFNQDMSSWSTNALTNARTFVTATTSSFNQSLGFLTVGNYGGTPLASNASVLVAFPASTSNANVLSTIDAWANKTFTRTASMGSYKFVISLSGSQVPYNDCRSYDAYTKTLTWAIYSGGASGSVTPPTGCGATPVVTWTPTTTPTNITLSNGVYSFTPDALPTVTGSDGNVGYVVASSSVAANCSVSPSGLVTFTIAGSTCTVKAYTTDPSKSIGYSAAVVFAVDIAPDAPVIASWQRNESNNLDFNVVYQPQVNNGSAITWYQYSTDNGATWRQVRTWDSVTRTVTIRGKSNTTTDVLDPGVDYAVKLRAVNTVTGAASTTTQMFWEVAPVYPTNLSAVPGDASMTVYFTPGLNKGSPIQKYQYKTNGGSVWADAIGTTSPVIINKIPETGLPLVNGTTYSFQLRAVNYLASGVNSGANAIARPDAQPGAPTVTSITPSSAQLSVAFTPGTNTGTAITKYQYSTDGGTTWKDRAFGTTASPLAITTVSGSSAALVNGTTYQVQIRAFNSLAGIATASTAAMPDALPGAPTSLTIAPSSGRLDVSFTTGTNTGSAITTYEYSTDGGTTWRVRATGTTESPVSITRASSDNSALVNGTSYNVKLRAFNTGAGTASTQVAGIPDTLPEAPTNLDFTPSDKQLSVAFTQPTNAGSAITKYQYSTDGGATWKDKAVTSSPFVINVLSSSTAQLVNGTAYWIKIRAFNTSAGAESTAVSAKADIVLAAPTLGAITVSNDQLSVAFTAPSVPTGATAITTYQYSTDGGVTWRTRASGTVASPLVIATASADNATLSVGSTYDLQLRAFNSIPGTATATVSATLATAPDAPTGAAAVRGNAQATVSWTAPSDDGGSAITGYTVTSNPGSFTCSTTSATSCDVTGLTNGTSYTFTVTATNAVGTSSASAASSAVTPATLPGAPTLSTPVSGDGKITVSWQAPVSDGGESITGYTATTTVGGFTCTTSTLTCDITGLTNGTTYTVKVLATNAIGDSIYSGTYSIKPQVLPGAPTITSVVVGNKTITIFFTAPAANGGSAITKYYYTTNAGNGYAQVNSTTSPLVVDKSTVTGLALVNGTSYNVQIAAYNTGMGAWSTSVSATPNILPASPVAPSAVAGEGQATVSWSASPSNGGTAVTGYTVTSTPGGFTCTTTGATTCDVTGLTNGVAYTFTVFATNAFGNGPATSATGAVKPDVAPGAPTGLTLERGDGTLAVSFTPGPNSGSAIVKYQYSLNGTFWSDFSTNSTATTQTISGLANGALYSVYLRAVNTLFGAASNYVDGTPRAAPGAPASFALTPGFKEISVSWATAIGGGSGMGTTGGSNITKYQYSLNGGPWIDFAGTSSPQVITGLLNAVSYSVKIRAYSDIPGVESAILNASPIKNSQAPLELTVAETVTWTNILNRTATLTYSVGGSLTLQSTGGSGTGIVVYTVTNDSACSVVNTTLMLPNVGATCKVTATKVADGDYSSEDSPIVWIVTQRAQQVPLVWKSETSVIFGQTFDVTYAGGSGSGAIAVSSQNTSVCTVVGSILTGVGVGTCDILVEKAASTNYQATSVLQTVTVGAASQTVSFTSTVPATPVAGDTYNVTASSTSGALPTFTIDSGACTIAGGQVSFTSSGDCVIRASASLANFTNASKTQTVSVGQRNQTLSFALAIQNMTYKTYGAPAFFADASTTEPNLNPSYALGSATTNSACIVSSSGIVQIQAAGVCEIEVSQAGNSSVAAASTISKVFTVLPDQASQPFITSVSAGHQSITVAFIKPSYSGGSPITAFRINAVHSGGVESTSACPVVAGSTQTCTISGLTNGVSYQVKVAAITLAGVGVFSDLAAPRVPATNPAAVSAFTAVPDNTSIVLTWADPISLGGGVFDSYRIFHKRSSDAQYPTTYINLTSQTPLTYTINGLTNGEAYDVKIVTVTTANTASLVSNTAEVKETPRTVPDAPATLDVLQVAGNLVITWAAPQSDGGNPVSEFSVTVNGISCSLANALDNLCIVPVPTSPGVHPIEVRAKNDAGFGSPAVRSFTIASVQSNSTTPAPNNPGAGTPGIPAPGGEESAPTPDEALQVISLSITKVSSKGGQVVTATGKNLAGVTVVLVDDKKAKIISVSEDTLKFEVPANSNGPATLKFSSPKASFEMVDALTYLNGTAKVSVSWVLGYVQANTTLSSKAKLQLKAALRAHPTTVAITCIGYQSYSYDTAFDAKVALGRAKLACNYLKTLNRKLVIKTAVARTNLTGTPSRKLAVQFRPTK